MGNINDFHNRRNPGRSEPRPDNEAGPAADPQTTQKRKPKGKKKSDVKKTSRSGSAK